MNRYYRLKSAVNNYKANGQLWPTLVLHLQYYFRTYLFDKRDHY